MANTFYKIETATVAAGGSSSITFSTIPSTYTDLVIKWSVRSSRTSATFDGPWMRFNNDSGNNYKIQTLNGNNGSAPTATTTATYGVEDRLYIVNAAPSSTATSNSFGSIDMYIFNYATTNRNKTVYLDGFAPNNSAATDGQYCLNLAGLWNSTAAISTITLGVYNGNLVENTVATLYGISSS